MQRLALLATVGFLAVTMCACSLFVGHCLSLQRRGEVTTVTGRVAAGEITMEVVPYDQAGSQNNVEISWEGQGTADGPNIKVYATDLACSGFALPPKPMGSGDPCVEIGLRGGSLAEGGEFVQRRLIVAGTTLPGLGHILMEQTYLGTALLFLACLTAFAPLCLILSGTSRDLWTSPLAPALGGIPIVLAAMGILVAFGLGARNLFSKVRPI